MTLLLDVGSWLLFLIGGGILLIGGIGVLRMPTLFTRMHAASLTDTLGTIAVLLGIMLQAGLTLATLKLLAVLLFLMLTGPTASYALANAALLAGHGGDEGPDQER
jgi:multicomponent Na+:H+ antiporter subunit G